MSAINRHRFRFNLRSLFIVLTMAGCFCWLSYQLNWIKQRHAVLGTGVRGPLCYDVDYLSLTASARAPGILWLFGEPGCSMLIVKFNGPNKNGRLTLGQEEEFQRIKQLFPEATDIRSLVW